MDEALFRRAAIIRHFEERLLGLFSEGRLSGTVHTCIGQELCALAVVDNLEEGDWIFSNHRCHGHYLAWSSDVRGLLAEIMGIESGICAAHRFYARATLPISRAKIRSACRMFVNRLHQQRQRL